MGLGLIHQLPRVATVSTCYKKIVPCEYYTPGMRKIVSYKYTRSKKFSPKNYRNVEFRDGMGPRLGNEISPCFSFFEG